MARTAREGIGPRPAGGPRPRPLPHNPRRTAGDYAKAFLAFVALAVLLIGVPGSLAYFVGWPLPHTVPSGETLRQPITTTVFVKVLTVVVWLAWAQFTACVLVEGKAELSGVGMPTRIPGAGPSQLLARQLVAAVLLVGATAASLTPGLSQLGKAYDSNHRGTVAAAQQTPGHQQGRHAESGQRDGADAGMRAQGMRSVDPTMDDRAEQASRHGEKSTKFYRIQPPEGRHHDSLWEVADRHLGDGRRYKEIYELNKDRVQPDGSRLSQASLIRPGWIMEMPADAYGGELVEMPDEAPKVSPDVRQQIQDYDRSGSHADQRQVDRQRGGAQHANQVGEAHEQPSADGSDRSRDEHGDEHRGEAAASSDADSSFGLPEALIAAPLLAAGLLAALGRRRRAALWRAAVSAMGRSTGIDLTPRGSAADAQDALLVGADPDAVHDLDGALRGLSLALADDNRQLPTVYAVWVTDAELQLQLAAPSGEPPAPWRPGQNRTSWRVRRADIRPPEKDDTAAPYPGLVSLGTVGGARLLLNLEAVPGTVSLTGSEVNRTAVLASVAAELATNGWSDRLTVTLVGFGEQLGALAPTRVRHVEDIDALIEVMAAETQQRRGALGAAGHDSVLTGRMDRSQHTQRAPHLVLLATEPSDEQAARLAELAADSGRLGIGYLIGTGRDQLPGATWELEITDDGRLLAPLLGLELTAQVLPEAQYRAVVELFTAADPEEGPDPGGAGSDVAPPPFKVDITERGRPAVYARLVGPYEIIGLGTPDDDRSSLLHEALALLLLHREGVHPRVLGSALWPRGSTEDVRDALIDRLRDWLGHDPVGTPRLSWDDTGRLTLAASVVSDLDVLRTLHHEATEGRGARSASVRERLLSDALALARGPLLADRPADRYAWLAHELIEVQLPLLVVDVALALSAHHRDAGRPDRAAESLNAALATAQGDERLWNELLRAVHATGDQERLRATAESLVRNEALNGGARGLPSRTEALLDELLPSWRGPREVAN
ncbi:BTAD domain-containing putative transcriptional regulator [Streptomyces iranensis]|uniref:BTAD domain-containing putative transcriptional regulator n=1 Tax=Streptomyces iranensis TaxID=576784 RepID=UPI0039B78EC0